MKKKELEYFINNMLINKEDVLLSLRDYIEYCKETKEENWSKKKREIIIKILFIKHNFFNIQNNWNKYIILSTFITYTV